MRRVLIIANRTPATPALLHEVERFAREEWTAFGLLVPAVSGSGGADWTTEVALRMLKPPALGRLAGLASGPASFAAIRAAVDSGDYDEIILATRPKRRLHLPWRDLRRRVKAFGLPVTVVALDEWGRLRRDDGILAEVRIRIA